MVLSSTNPSAEVSAGETPTGATPLSTCHAAWDGIGRGRGGRPAPKRPRLFLSPSLGDISSKAPSAMIFWGDLDSIWKLGPRTYMYEPQKDIILNQKGHHYDGVLPNGTHAITMYIFSMNVQCMYEYTLEWSYGISS